MILLTATGLPVEGRRGGGRSDRSAHLERHGGQSDADGAGLVGAGDPALHHRNHQERIHGRRNGTGRHRRFGRLQPALHQRRLRRRHSRRRNSLH